MLIEEMLASVAANMGHISVIMGFMLVLNIGIACYFVKRMNAMEEWLEKELDDIRWYIRNYK